MLKMKQTKAINNIKKIGKFENDQNKLKDKTKKREGSK